MSVAQHQNKEPSPKVTVCSFQTRW